MAVRQFHEVCKEMRVPITMDDVKEFISILRNAEDECDQRAFDLERASESCYLDKATKDKLVDAADREREMARKWNAIWAVFDHASYHSMKDNN
jgi:ferritin-like protein